MPVCSKYENRGLNHILLHRWLVGWISLCPRGRRPDARCSSSDLWHYIPLLFTTNGKRYRLAIVKT